MGCKASKVTIAGTSAVPATTSTTSPVPEIQFSQTFLEDDSPPSKKSTFGLSSSQQNQQSMLYKLLVKAQKEVTMDIELQNKIIHNCTAAQAAYVSVNTNSTALHMAVRLLDIIPSTTTSLTTTTTTTTTNAGTTATTELCSPMNSTNKYVLLIVEHIIKAFPDAVRRQDSAGNLPLHYAIAPCSYYNNNNSSTTKSSKKDKNKTTTSSISTTHIQSQPQLPATTWKVRKAVVQLIMTAEYELAYEYMHRNDLYFYPHLHCSALYRALQQMPDDFESTLAHGMHRNSPTAEYIAILRELVDSPMVSNASDQDKPLALLYRRFTRQFDLAEKFFTGDNSRREVIDYRHKYKTAAANTWKIIEILLHPEDDESNKNSNNNSTSSSWHMVHRAVQVETPPDLLRYIVETNAQDLTVPDVHGYLPLHYAAMNKGGKQAFPAYYTKYVVDELLYKFPEAASRTDPNGNYPLTLAVQAGKQWIGGGIKSLYDAFPDALDQIDIKEHESLRRAMSIDEDQTNQNNLDVAMEEKKEGEVIRDEHHDAIMLVQETLDVGEIVTSMWAHEEDAGVQMLGCMALRKILLTSTTAAASESTSPSSAPPPDVLRIALSGVAAVVNAMKAHPNEVIVQEKACQVLTQLAPADGHAEISFVASGAVAAIVGALQAHVSDPTVQEEACHALVEIMAYGGADRATIVASVSGLTAMVNALSAHPNVEGVQAQACHALRNLTNYSNISSNDSSTTNNNNDINNENQQQEQDNANIPELPRSQMESLLEHARDHFNGSCREHVEILLTRLT